jgi:hypothetical protein
MVLLLLLLLLLCWFASNAWRGWELHWQQVLSG